MRRLNERFARARTWCAIAGVVIASAVSSLADDSAQSISASGDLTVSGEVDAGLVDGEDVFDLDLDDLMEVEVGIVAGRSQRVSDTPAAVFVITREDIRRSGLRSLPELLRLVPGMHVAHLDANKWAIAARGFNSRFATQLLVLIDGRAVYTPIFSGVIWDLQDVLLEDVERVEVVRGPGGTLWGANAVNGVINVITRHARDTQGVFVQAGGGSERMGDFSGRYGHRLAENAFVRVFGRYFIHDDFVDANDDRAHDGWYAGHLGFRLDWEPTTEDLVTVQGDLGYARVQSREFQPLLTAPFGRVIDTEDPQRIGNLLARWSRRLSETSELTVQSYYYRTDREGPISNAVLDTFDVTLQHRWTGLDRHDIVAGAGYRLQHDRVPGSLNFTLKSPSETYDILSAFAQDEISLVREHLALTLGSKLEYNDFTGLEVQPSARLLWKPVDSQALWLSVSRAVRTPSRVNDDLSFLRIAAVPGPPLGLNEIIVNPTPGSIDAEDLLAVEAGWRSELLEDLVVDLTAYVHAYDDFIATRGEAPVALPGGTPPRVQLGSHFDNAFRGDMFGVEAVAQWRATDRWRVVGTAGWSRARLQKKSGISGGVQEPERLYPRHTASIRSELTLPGEVDFDVSLYYVDQITDRNVPSYFRLDVRLAWRPLENFELSVVGQNLLDDRHPEWNGDLFGVRSEVERAVYAQASWAF